MQRLALLLAVVVAVVAAVPRCPAQAEVAPAPWVRALEAAGDNRAELERALADVPDEHRRSLEFLLAHMPERDARSLTAAFLLQQVALAHAAREQAPWGQDLDDDLFLGFVLPYAQANEAREDWRSDFVRRFAPLVAGCATPGEAALRLNAGIFDALGVRYSTGRARADQAPSSSIAQGKASCTGLSILLADACRAVGVPARLISVVWPHKPGNHTWVEVWDGGGWHFLGAAEPDPAGLDRAWFVGDAARCSSDDGTHAIWAVSYAATGTRFRAGWAPGIQLHGIDVTARYTTRRDGEAQASANAVDEPAARAADAAVRVQLDRFFAAPAEVQATFEFDRNLDAELATAAGDARLRALAWEAYRAAAHTELRADHAAGRVRAGGYESPYTVREVGERPADGWGLVIAMHGGGGVPKNVNDQQWRVMQRYYRDQPQAGGYRYVALRAPTDEWNGFYTDYVYPLVTELIRQFVVCGDVAPDRVVLIGYSHGGYGAFAIAPKMPDRFAAAHASAAAPTDGETSPAGLHHLAFSFLVGARDTAYGRADRCNTFQASVAALQRDRPGLYPVTGAVLEGHRHTGLPDRDKLADLLPLRRQATPRVLVWEQTDAVVRDHYWLGVDEAAKGKRIEAALSGQELSVTAPAGTPLHILLDARLCDLEQPVTVTVNGAEQRIEPSPSLRTLCATMQRRGDRDLAGSFGVRLLP